MNANATSEPDWIHQLARSLQSGSEPAEICETHISWVVLVDDVALKIKKPLSNPFLDYSTLEKRLASCIAELRLNRRYAPEIYDSVVGITASANHETDSQFQFEPVQADSGFEDVPFVEFAVKMRRFPASALLSHRLDHGLVTNECIDQLAKNVAEFHNRAAIVDQCSPWSTPELVTKDAMDNIEFLREHLPRDRSASLDSVHHLESWTRTQSQHLLPLFQSRRDNGFVRECHGDLHSGNIVNWNEHFIPFDGIEFSEQLRWIDVQSDAAFLSMDLAFHGHSTFAYRFTNAYLEATGDYEGTAVLRWYQVYRALVRAKVTLMRAQQEAEADRYRVDVNTCCQFVQLADSIAAATTTPRLVITHGLSGSGKTYGSQHLVDEQGLIRIRSDVERKRMFQHLRQTPNTCQMYEADATEKVYRVLENLAESLLTSGFSVLVDATFLKSTHRQRFLELANKLNVAFAILPFAAEVATLITRIENRAKAGNDASDADIEVLRQQLSTQEPLTEAEKSMILKSQIDNAETYS